MSPVRPLPIPVHGLEHGMAVRTRGGGSRTLVWIHGLGESGRCFDTIAAHPHLLPYRHVVPDLPGYGRSPWRSIARGLDATVEDLAEWLRARDEDAVVIGHSLGGVLATLVAERHPDVLRAVIDVDGNVSLGDCTFSSQFAALSEDAFADGGFARLWGELYASAGDDLALRGYAASMAFADPHQLWHHASELVALSRGETMAARRARLSVPLLFVAGAPRGVCERSRELLTQAGVTMTDVAPAGHWPFIDQPEAFAEVVARFVESLG